MWVESRVTRLGDFSLTRRVFYFWLFFNVTEVAQNLATFSKERSCVLILKNNGLGNTLGDFSKTHLVTLVEGMPNLARARPFEAFSSRQCRESA
jgi:hypothetical protein